MSSSLLNLSPQIHVSPSHPNKKTPLWIPNPQLLSKYPLLHQLSSCKSMKHLQQIHAQTITTGIFADNFVASRILSFSALSPHGSLPYARSLFVQIPKPDPFIANTLIRAFVSSGNPIDALLFYIQILESPLLSPDIHTIPLLLKACSEIPSLVLGKAIHSHIYKFGWFSHVSVLNSLVHMYFSCGSVDSAEIAFNGILSPDNATWNIMVGGYLNCGRFEVAHRVFDEMPERSTISWSAMINGNIQNSCFKEALELFRKMLAEKVEPNESVLVNVISACARLGAMEQGKWVEGYVRRKNIEITVQIGTALVDMYLKCGWVEKALEIFDEMRERNVLAWTAMIGGLAVNGRGKDALHLFSQMEVHGVRPNHVTFVGVLNACSHSRLVDDGVTYFNSMTSTYGLKPNIQHYCCMVDLYGRAGLLGKAKAVIESMPMEPNPAVWGALLNACRIHGNSQLGEQIGKQLLELEPNHSGRYVLLSNVYAAEGRWVDVANLRRVMRERGVTKTPGCSFIDLGGTVHEFIAGDNLHPLSEEIYAKLDEMNEVLKSAGYKPNKGQVLLDMDEEEKETAIFHHSEKLAIAFGLIRSEMNATIRVTKNLRVCTDCHAASKLLSKIYKREIVVRDRSRFHHFKDGSCSCLDFW